MFTKLLLVIPSIYDGISGFTIAFVVLLLVVPLILVASLHRSPPPSRFALASTGWVSLVLSCVTILLVSYLGMISEDLTARLVKRDDPTKDIVIIPAQVAKQQNASLQRTVQLIFLIVPLVSGGLGVNLIVAGITTSVRTTRSRDRDELP